MANSNLEEAKIRAAAMFLNFSSLLGKDVLDSDRKFIGKLWDISAKTSEVYPKSDELIIAKGFIKRYYASVPFLNVLEIDGEVILNIKSDEVKFETTPKEYEFLLRRDAEVYAALIVLEAFLGQSARPPFEGVRWNVRWN